MDNLKSVSTLSVVFMAVTAALALLVPIILVIVLGVKKKLKIKATLFGALMFVVFALVLENILHTVVLGADPAKSPIYQNAFLFMLYGGFAAGIFEETARFICFKFILRTGREESIYTGISYGLGHGGVESILIGGLAAISNLIYSILINNGMLQGMSSSLSSEQLNEFNKGIDSLINTPSYMFLAGGIERMIALALHIALSLFVLKAVTQKKWQYFVYAVFIHAGVDMIAVLYQKGILSNIFLVEGLILIAMLATVAAAFKISKKEPAPVIENMEQSGE